MAFLLIIMMGLGLYRYQIALAVFLLCTVCGLFKFGLVASVIVFAIGEAIHRAASAIAKIFNPLEKE